MVRGDQVPMGAAPGACMTAMTLAGTGWAQNDGNFGRITISITRQPRYVQNGTRTKSTVSREWSSGASIQPFVRGPAPARPVSIFFLNLGGEA